ncbi:MAG: hypothetical protein AAGA48_03740 [Myxococcota bacterium]
MAAPFLFALFSSTANAQVPYVHFESGPVRPVATSPDGTTLFVTNVTDGHLEVFEIEKAGLTWRGSVPVGLEPVTVAARSNDEVWVVNHVSDSISIVDVPSLSVTRTLLVGDEPRDLVFAQDRAFITTAHRGQHRTDPSIADVPGAGDPQLTTPGISRADVWVFDATDPGPGVGGRPLRIVELFGDTPRPLAVSPDGNTVYAGIHHSGNQTTTLSEGLVCNGFDLASSCTVDGVLMPGGNPGPDENIDGIRAPEVGLIVKYDTNEERWLDELGRDWSDAVQFDLPDYDLFSIDATTLTESAAPLSGVGTTLFNIAVNPVSGALYVTNTDARNEVRFEGPGVTGGTTVQGHLAEARITVVENGAATSHHLNPHIDYDVLPAPAGTADHSLATPLDAVVSSDGSTLYVAAYGSQRIGVVPTAALTSGTFDPTTASSSYLELSGGGPAGLALDDSGNRLFVYTRFDHAIAVIDLGTGTEVDKHALYTPEPPEVIRGRALLYDARNFSSNGEASCAGCHVFGDLDHLAWDLGDPDAPLTTGTIPVRLGIAAGGNINGTGDPNDFHPMKGPMTTQTLRGLQYHGAQHWRGDRSVGFYGSDPFDANLSFRNFIVAFEGLLGMDGLPTDPQMDDFATFTGTIAMPPNPVRNLDRSYTSEQQAAFDFYVSPDRISDGIPIPNLGFNCDGCHTLDAASGFYGTDGRQSFENESQIMKIAQLRNLYTKVGMFGVRDVAFTNGGDNGFTGDQIRGFGFLHDGSIDTIFRFFSAVVFDSQGPNIGFIDDDERRAMESLMLAFDSDISPILGQQITVTAPDDLDAVGRAEALRDAAVRPFVSRLLGGAVTDCDLVARVTGSDRVRGYLYDGTTFIADDDTDSVRFDDLIADSATEPVTFTAVLPGSGERFALDRDGDELYNGIDPCPTLPDSLDCGELKPKPEPPTDTGMPGPSDTGTDTPVPEPQDVNPPELTTCGCASSDPRGAAFGFALLLAVIGLRRRRVV